MAYVVISPVVVIVGLLIAYFTPNQPQYDCGDESVKGYQQMMENSRKLNIK